MTPFRTGKGAYGLIRGWIALLALIALLWPAQGEARSLVETNAVRVSDSAAKATKAAKVTKKRKRRRRRRRRWRPNFVQLKEGPGVHVLHPKRAWGTKLMVRRLEELTSAYHEAYPEAPPIWVHDLSGRRGGRLRPHLSHRRGRDVDIRLILKKYSEKYRRASRRTLHLEKTWFMLKHLVDSGDVEVVFLDRRLQRALYRYARKQGYTRDELKVIFQFPRNRGAVIRHWRGHADHIHVRFRREPRPVPMV